MHREEHEKAAASNTFWAEFGSEALLVKYIGTVEVWGVIVEVPDNDFGIIEALYGMFDNEPEARDFFAEVTVRQDWDTTQTSDTRKDGEER